MALDIGSFCRKGLHRISSENDLAYTFHNDRGKSYAQCIHCKRETDRAKSKRRSERRAAENPQVKKLISEMMYSILLSCSHPLVFFPPLPQPEEEIYCQRCQDYRIVKGWGDAIRRVSGVRTS